MTDLHNYSSLDFMASTRTIFFLSLQCHAARSKSSSLSCFCRNIMLHSLFHSETIFLWKRFSVRSSIAHH